MLDLSTLNAEQLEAVMTTEGPLLVLAGAGSGKTRVITYRLAHLLRQGVNPRNILAVTFTNKAAKEMRERARDLAGRAARGVTLSTFHALGAAILRAHAERVGLKPRFTITDSAEQLGSVRRMLRTLRIDDRKFDAKRILHVVTSAKNAGLTPAALRATGGVLGTALDDELDDDYRVACIEVYDRYASSLVAQNVVDFDDLLLLPLNLLRDDEEIRASLQARWRYLMIDEYQDTNGAQLEIMRLLAGDKPNLCVVGDDDQSIYGWRGADVANILGFEKHFPGAKRVMLLTNYRSTACILGVANAVISENPGRYDKQLRPAGETGQRVRIVGLDDEDLEADAVGDAIESLTAGNTPADEIAVLYRSNVQSRSIELALRQRHVPYRVVGGMDLFDKKEIKDALAYLRLLINPDDEQALRRIVNYPPRGIGDTTIKRLDDWGREEGLGLLDSMRRAEDISTLSERARTNVFEFVSLLDEHRRKLGRLKASTVAKRCIEASGLEAAVFASSDQASRAARKVDNVREVLRQVNRYEERVQRKKSKSDEDRRALKISEGMDLETDELFDAERGTLEGFLADLALGGFDEGAPRDESERRVVLSTIHAAKGLEWPHVFLVGAEEELLPHRRTLEGLGGEIPEERRLAYVAVTRAKKELVVTWAKNRTRFGKIVPRTRSRFFEGLPEDVADSDGSTRPERTEEELQQIESDWRAKIRAQLGMD